MSMPPPPSADMTAIIDAVVGLDVRPWAFEARQLGPITPGQEYTAVIQTDFGLQSAPQGFGITYKFALTATVRGAPQPFLRLGYEVVASYSGSGTFAEESLRQFAATYAIVQVYPYFRSFVQSTCAQMALPALTLPAQLLLKHQPAPDATAPGFEPPTTH